MSGPRDLSSAELERCGLGLVQRRAAPGGPVTRIYCIHCGSQVASERRETDPDGWWTCVRGCNTRYAPAPLDPPARPTT